jgi:RNA polymerase sigma-70 factor (ECF subfamily)
VSVDALKSRLHRARAALREALRPTLEEAAPPATARCPDVLALWSKRLEGDLSSADCAAMERHLEGCASCGSACEALKRTLWVCQQQARPVVSEATRAAIRRAVEAARAR